MNARHDTDTTDSAEATQAREQGQRDDAEGRLSVVGLGPGGHAEMTVRAQEVLLDADRLVGTPADLDRVPDLVRRDAAVAAVGADGSRDSPGDRARRAAERAGAGERVALVSGGPDAYALAGTAFDAARAVGADGFDAEVVPGVPPARACAARLGAPLGGDVASLSLSDRLGDWPEVEARLRAVAAARLPVALSNPWPADADGRRRYERACDAFEAARPADTPVGIVRGAGGPDERTAATLADLRSYGDTDLVDATATVLIGDPDSDRWRDWLATAD